MKIVTFHEFFVFHEYFVFFRPQPSSEHGQCALISRWHGRLKDVRLWDVPGCRENHPNSFWKSQNFIFFVIFGSGDPGRFTRPLARGRLRLAPGDAPQRPGPPRGLTTCPTFKDDVPFDPIDPGCSGTFQGGRIESESIK